MLANFMEEKVSFFSHSAKLSSLRLTGVASRLHVAGGMLRCWCCLWGPRGWGASATTRHIRRASPSVTSSNCSSGRWSSFPGELVFISPLVGECNGPCFPGCTSPTSLAPGGPLLSSQPSGSNLHLLQLPLCVLGRDFFHPLVSSISICQITDTLSKLHSTVDCCLAHTSLLVGFSDLGSFRKKGLETLCSDSDPDWNFCSGCSKHSKNS